MLSLTFLALFIARAHIRMRSLNISVDLSLFVLRCNTNFIKSLNSMIFSKLKQTKNNLLTVNFFFNLQKDRRECFVCISILLVLWSQHTYTVSSHFHESKRKDLTND